MGNRLSCKLVSSQDKNVKLSVNNVLKEIRILNVFGVIKGFEEPDRYVIVGPRGMPGVLELQSPV